MPDSDELRLVLRRWMVVFAVFVVYGAWPTPDSGQTQYLAQARHFWDPQWCPHDLFLNSPAPHWLFCATAGWLAVWLPLPVVAILGRVATWGLLAAGWSQMSRALRLSIAGTALSAACFV